MDKVKNCYIGQIYYFLMVYIILGFERGKNEFGAGIFGFQKE